MLAMQLLRRSSSYDTNHRKICGSKTQRHIGFASFFRIFIDMADEELKKYRLSSMEEPSDEMLEALMEKVGAAARESSRKAEEAMNRMHAEVASNIAQKKLRLGLL